MKGALFLKTAPVTEPITRAQAKAHIRVEAAVTEDDTLIDGLITAARRWIEGVTGIRMVTQTINYYLDSFPNSATIHIPVGPVSAVSSVKYTAVAGTVSTLSADNYTTDLVSLPARVTLKSTKSWPTEELKISNGVDIEFVAGYGAASGLVAARADLTAAEALVAAAVTAPEITAAKAALAAAALAVSAAETAAQAEIPEELKIAVKMLVEHWYEHRGAVTELTLAEAPMAVQSLISGFMMYQREF